MCNKIKVIYHPAYKIKLNRIFQALLKFKTQITANLKPQGQYHNRMESRMFLTSYAVASVYQLSCEMEYLNGFKLWKF